MKNIVRNTVYTIITLNKLRKLKMFSGNVIILTFISIFIYIIFTIFNIYSFGFVNEFTTADAAVILGASVRKHQQ
jgi:hypothetical protein